PMQTQQQQRRFPPDLVQALGNEEEVQIEPRSGHPVTIWIVVVDDLVYVRSYKGTGGRWYQTVRSNREGVLHVDGRQIPFRATLLDDAHTIERVSEVYQRKYAAKWPKEAADMLRQEILPTTVRLEPLEA